MTQFIVKECVLVFIFKQSLDDTVSLFPSFSTYYRSGFAVSSATYNKLGHFKYNPEDFSLPIEVKYGKEYVSVGQFKPATNTLHGIGIRVEYSGYICEGYWKDGNRDGNGRYTGIKVENIKLKIRFE